MSAAYEYNGVYKGEHLDRIAFPLGGIGAGMVCLEGVGGLTHLSMRNTIEFYHEPKRTFAALTIKGGKNTARVLEGPNPEWKYFGAPGTGNGASGFDYGLPRFAKAEFLARFPFATVNLEDDDVPLEVELTGWSPFIPGNADDSSLPAAFLEYRFKNTTRDDVEAMFSFNTENFMGKNDEQSIRAFDDGFLLRQEPSEDKPWLLGECAVWVDDSSAVVDHCWFKGGWWDSITLAWRNIAEGIPRANPPQEGRAPGASIFVPFKLAPGEEKTFRVHMAWHVPNTTLRFGEDPKEEEASAAGESACCSGGECTPRTEKETHVPWYAGRFENAAAVARYAEAEYDRLRADSALFRDAFYRSTLPPEVTEAVAANLTILKSPTVLRQTDGRIWAWEGCGDSGGCCMGTCTHVWNYAQAMPHLFPDLERTMRRTEFNENQYPDGRQVFRGSLPIRQSAFPYPASDGQLGSIMQVYREWRISGDNDWLREYWPKVQQSMDFCISYWDPRETGLLEEHHHNTYDIDYWGPDGHVGSFYLGALTAFIRMGEFMNADTSRYQQLLEKGLKRLHDELWNGEYFIQKIEWEGYERPPQPLNPEDNGEGYRDVVDLINEQGTRYQYGVGCLSDGVLGFWMARMSGLEEPIADEQKVAANLKNIHKYNIRHDLRTHANPQRPSFAMGDDGGLLLCTWPHGGELAIPFVYSDEVWTGIEYQVASHLMLEGMVDEGLEIVRVCRDRFDGRRRNPFNEYECGHWYARAMSSYGLIQGLTGIRYDAVDKTLYIDSKIGDDFTSFLSTASGFGVAGLKNGKPFVSMSKGKLKVEKVLVSGQEMELVEA
jgi:uncharacterized protein (DUF608 family)